MIRQTDSLIKEYIEFYNSMDEEEKKKIDPLDFGNSILSTYNNGNQTISSIASELDLGVDFLNNRIYLVGEIKEYDGIFIQQKMSALTKMMEIDSNNPIQLIVDSGGGDVYSMFTIIDSIQLCERKVSTIGFGNIMSAASLILASGTGPRLLAPHTSIMVHQMSASMDGPSSQLKANAAQIEQLENTWLELYSKFTGKSKSWWKSKMAKDFFLDAKTAIKYGLADDLLTKENFYA